MRKAINSVILRQINAKNYLTHKLL